ncbi:MAG: glycosyltransferase family 4 protein [Gammaproteobacteria bacterium]|nr:glycosyltransferase family 4 protein [Gammaproteobacteria bacterium]
MKTVLHAIDTTGPGGAETVFVDLATRLPADKYRSIVLIRGKGWVYEELSRRGVTPQFLDAKGSFNWHYLKGLVDLIRQERVDLIQAHLLGTNVYCSLAGLLTRKPVVATFHGTVDIGEQERFKALKFGAVKLGARCVVAVSDSLREDIANRAQLRPGKIKIVHNGVDIAKFRRPRSDVLRQQHGWSSDNIIIGSLGNIRPAKGYDILLRAAALLKNSAASIRFVIAGQGKSDLYVDLLKLRSQLGLNDTVHFLGFNDDPAGFLSNLDLFLMSSTSEGFPLATIQAMAAKLPVIATRSGGPEEIITHGETGWLVDPGSPAAIAEAVVKLATDRALCERMAANGREHATRTFGIDTMLKAYQAIYEKLTQERAGPQTA